MLSQQVIKWPSIFPTDHVGTLDYLEFFEAALLLKNLSQGFQLADAFWPFPFRSPKAVAEFGCQSLKVEIVFREVVDRIVAFGLNFDVIQIGIHRAGDVARECPWRRGPDEHVFFCFHLFLLPRIGGEGGRQAG